MGIWGAIPPPCVSSVPGSLLWLVRDASLSETGIWGASSCASWSRSGPLGSGGSFCRSPSSGSVPSGEWETSEGGRGCGIGAWRASGRGGSGDGEGGRGSSGGEAGTGGTLFVGTFLSGRRMAGSRSDISALRDPSRAAGSGCGLEGEAGTRSRGSGGGGAGREGSRGAGSGSACDGRRVRGSGNALVDASDARSTPGGEERNGVSCDGPGWQRLAEGTGSWGGGEVAWGDGDPWAPSVSPSFPPPPACTAVGASWSAGPQSRWPVSPRALPLLLPSVASCPEEEEWSCASPLSRSRSPGSLVAGNAACLASSCFSAAGNEDVKVFRQPSVTV